jgi:Pheophorbide a oxygenase
MPGKGRLVALFGRNFAQQAGIFFPRWWEHLKIRNRVIDSDMVILQNQEYFLAQQQQSWKTAYKMPTAADRFVIEFRRWLDTHCEGKFPWANFGITPSPVTLHEDRRQIMDRYAQHTRHCSSCRQALGRIKIAKLSLSAIGILLVTIATVLPDSIRFTIGLPLLIISAIVGLIAFGLHSQVEPKFYFEDYPHPDAK